MSFHPFFVCGRHKNPRISCSTPDPNSLPHARLGVVAAKRFAPRAVTRNTIKRVTRELFRTSQLQAVDCIVRLSRPVNGKDGPATTRALKAELRAELARLFASQRPRRPAPTPTS